MKQQKRFKWAVWVVGIGGIISASAAVPATATVSIIGVLEDL
ncbi:MAG: hypothetical protein ACXWPM_11235 [Bdellovibrionota bacterium]